MLSSGSRPTDRLGASATSELPHIDATDAAEVVSDLSGSVDPAAADGAKTRSGLLHIIGGEGGGHPVSAAERVAEGRPLLWRRFFRSAFSIINLSSQISILMEKWMLKDDTNAKRSILFFMGTDAYHFRAEHWEILLELARGGDVDIIRCLPYAFENLVEGYMQSNEKMDSIINTLLHIATFGSDEARRVADDRIMKLWRVFPSNFTGENRKNLLALAHRGDVDIIRRLPHIYEGYVKRSMQSSEEAGSIIDTLLIISASGSDEARRVADKQMMRLWMIFGEGLSYWLDDERFAGLRSVVARHPGGAQSDEVVIDGSGQGEEELSSAGGSVMTVEGGEVSSIFVDDQNAGRGPVSRSPDYFWGGMTSSGQTAFSGGFLTFMH